MAINLSTYKNVQQATFVRLEITENGLPVVVRMSTHDVPFPITEYDGQTYTYPCVGALLNIGEITYDYKSSMSDVAISLSAIPEEYMNDIMNNPIQGSPVEIRRVFFDANTGQKLNIADNPAIDFTGIVNSYTFDEDDSGGQDLTFTATLTCSSFLTVYNNMKSGRRTNQADQDYWFPGDKCFNRVAVISEQNFYLGGTTPSSGSSTAASITMTGTANK